MTQADAVRLALAAGFTAAVPLDVSTLTPQPQVRDYCAEDKCAQYGKNWACPPHCGTLEACAAAIRQYSHGIHIDAAGFLVVRLAVAGGRLGGAVHHHVGVQFVKQLPDAVLVRYVGLHEAVSRSRTKVGVQRTADGVEACVLRQVVQDAPSGEPVGSYDQNSFLFHKSVCVFRAYCVFWGIARNGLAAGFPWGKSCCRAACGCHTKRPIHWSRSPGSRSTTGTSIIV